MASLQGTSISNSENFIVSSSDFRHAGSDVTGWVEIFHCADATSTSICNPVYSCGWLHVRTPIPAESAALGWNPFILEVIGQHTYSGEYTHDWKALINVNGYDNSWYGSQITMNDSNHSSMFVYRSNSYYGSYRRVSFSLPKVGCCCTGRLFVRWFNGSGWFDNYPWATAAYNSQSAYY